LGERDFAISVFGGGDKGHYSVCADYVVERKQNLKQAIKKRKESKAITATKGKK